jgi:hypothetical protein
MLIAVVVDTAHAVVMIVIYTDTKTEGADIHTHALGCCRRRGQSEKTGDDRCIEHVFHIGPP